MRAPAAAAVLQLQTHAHFFTGGVSSYLLIQMDKFVSVVLFPRHYFKSGEKDLEKSRGQTTCSFTKNGPLNYSTQA
ncbi:hypothetical protein AAES_97538 [Amazona aestiva]|uniref:Uncharacterized protein n=1 Tax=Amazona aestiva TaxID=12930 RepID=A0A0Q3PGW2_AMAAE|nr:hypothetical protein AAES_97538 [Amazona aestiva]